MGLYRNNSDVIRDCERYLYFRNRLPSVKTKSWWDISWFMLCAESDCGLWGRLLFFRAARNELSNETRKRRVTVTYRNKIADTDGLPVNTDGTDDSTNDWKQCLFTCKLNCVSDSCKLYLPFKGRSSDCCICICMHSESSNELFDKRTCLSNSCLQWWSDWLFSQQRSASSSCNFTLTLSAGEINRGTDEDFRMFFNWQLLWTHEQQQSQLSVSRGNVRMLFWNPCCNDPQKISWVTRKTGVLKVDLVDCNSFVSMKVEVKSCM